jgi:hypothetical protein
VINNEIKKSETIQTSLAAKRRFTDSVSDFYKGIIHNVLNVKDNFNAYNACLKIISRSFQSR